MAYLSGQNESNNLGMYTRDVPILATTYMKKA